MLELKKKTMQQSTGNGQPIAIIGMGCRYPGAQRPEQLWKLLLLARDMVSKVPAQRFDVDALHSTESTPGKLLNSHAGIIDDVDLFDAEFFDISEDSAIHLDPQQRLLLMAAWEALEDAGIPPEKVAGSRTGVYVGNMRADYMDRHYQRGLENLVPTDVKSNRSLLPGRLAYFFDFRGPVALIDTACSSSLVSIHLACQSLRTGEASLALACGVNLKLLPNEDILASQLNMVAPDGRSKFGDASANGFSSSDGIGVVVLKPLVQALADGDRVRAVILGSAVSNDGSSSGVLLRPSVEGQVQTLKWAYENARVCPSDVDFVEAHGTGTPLIDPIEFMALGEFLGQGRSPDAPLFIGSVKSNIGHSEGASGLAAVIKTVLCLEHRQIPPSLHFQTPNPNVPWDRLPVTVPTCLHVIPDRGRLALAGVSGQGLSAVNVHLVLEEAAPLLDESVPSSTPRLFAISARTDKALRDLALSYLAYLNDPEQGAAFSLRDICHSSLHHRTHHACRFAAVVQDHASLLAALRRFLAEETSSGESAAPPPSADAQEVSLLALATRYMAGEQGDAWKPEGEAGAHFVPLPTYPWQTASYWLD